MRSVAIMQYGGPETLAVYDRPAAIPGPGEVAIDVEYAGVNYAEVLFRRGVVPNLTLPFVPGIEVAGHVRALGPGVTGLRVGEPVAALTIIGGGGYAEVAIAPATLVAPVPAGLRLDVAAGTPSNATTALMVLRDVARLARGETVVVHAAAGGVGSLLGQFARLLGAGRVIGTVGSPSKVPYARALGYDDVVVMSDLAEAVRSVTGGAGADIVVDQVGGAARRESLDILRPMGRMIAMGNASGADDVSISTNELWFSSRGVLGFNLRLLSEADPPRVGVALREALGHVARGEVRLDVTAVLPLTDAAEAHRRIEDRATRGKLVLDIRGGNGASPPR
jgi:NADPH2:quinone reductase